MTVTFAGYEFAVLLVEDLVLKDEGLAALGDPVREERDRKFSEVELVPSRIGTEKLPHWSSFTLGVARMHELAWPFSLRREVATTTFCCSCYWSSSFKNKSLLPGKPLKVKHLRQKLCPEVRLSAGVPAPEFGKACPGVR